jgi:thiamine-phosphate pyrophosphorylase
MSVSGNFGLYVILTDPVRGYEYVTEAAIAQGVRVVQLRIKDAPMEKIRVVAETLRKLTEGTDTRLIINDYPDLAALIGADGVHVGQDDLPCDLVREIVGPEAVIGLSTHSLAQTKLARGLKTDYIGVGPVFITPTKKNPDPVLGLARMREMIQAATVPAVAIGGIDLTNLPLVLEAGARNVCMVRAINNSENPEDVIKKALRILHENSRS